MTAACSESPLPFATFYAPTPVLQFDSHRRDVVQDELRQMEALVRNPKRCGCSRRSRNRDTRVAVEFNDLSQLTAVCPKELRRNPGQS
jgi:hypothetical protein